MIKARRDSEGLGILNAYGYSIVMFKFTDLEIESISSESSMLVENGDVFSRILNRNVFGEPAKLFIEAIY